MQKSIFPLFIPSLICISSCIKSHSIETPTNSCPIISHLRDGHSTEHILNQFSTEFEEEEPLAGLAQENLDINSADDYEEQKLIQSPLIKTTSHLKYSPKFFSSELKKQGFDDSYINKFNQIPRISGFTFFGTAQSPANLEKKNGICQISKDYDLLSYYISSRLGGAYISTTTSIKIAKWFASRRFGNIRNGYVYVVYVDGGFLDYSTKEKAIFFPKLLTKETYYNREQISRSLYKKIFNIPIMLSPFIQQEVAIFQGVNWNNFVAYSKINKDGNLVGNIFIRKNFRLIAPSQYKKIKCFLSGGNIQQCNG